MSAFTYELPVKVYFGENGVENHLAKELANYGPNIMLAYGKGSVKRNGTYDQIANVLRDCGKNIIDFGDIPSNPTYEKVQEGIRLYKENNVDLILAVGGGSVVDCCKIITAGTEVDEDIWEMEMVKHIIPEKMGNFAVVLTLSGAGAEMDRLGVCTNTALNEKQTFVASYAKFVILDPAYLMSAPLRVFMPGVYDSLSHCMETYFGRGTNVSDRMNEGLMRDIVSNMRRLISGEDTLEVRSNLMWDASLIQSFLFQLGRPGDFQAHSMENMLAAYSHGNHGSQLAVLMPQYYRRVYQADPAKFAEFARTVMDVDCDDDRQAALLGIEALEELISAAGLKTTLSGLGYELTEEVAREVSQKCGVSSGNVRQLSREEIFEILWSCR